MSKEYLSISSTSAGADPFATVGLQWSADTIIINNPTAYSVAVRVGSQSRPRDLTDCTIPCPPATLLCLPVNGKEFSFLLTTPTLLVAPQGMPTAVTVTLTQGEQPPAFGSVPLSGVSVSAVILRLQPDRAAGTYQDIIDLPSGVRSVIARDIGYLCGDFNVQGVQSGQIYCAIAGPVNYVDANFILPEPAFIVDSELDTQLRVTTSPTFFSINGYTLVGYQDRQERALVRPDGRQLVDIMPPGQSRMPVSLVGDKAPNIAQSGSVTAPAVGVTNVLNLLVLTSGLYRIHADLLANDSALIQRYITLQHTNNAITVVYQVASVPAPGGIGVDWLLQIATNERILVRIQNTAASTGFYQGSIAMYLVG